MSERPSPTPPVVTTGTRLRSALRDPARRERLGLLLAVAIWAVVTVLADPFAAHPYSTATDAHPYWSASWAEPYVRSTVGTSDAYLYSPAFLLLIAPLRLLPWWAFVAVWTALLLVALRATVGRGWLLYALLAGGFWEASSGNVTFIYAWMAVAGFARPWLYGFGLLTKVTPAIGLLYPLLRGEWRQVARAIAAVACLVGVSVLVGGVEPWRDWIDVLVGNVGAPQAVPYLHIGIPLGIRLPVAIAVVALAARTDRRALVPVAIMLALPVLWWGGLSLLLAVPRLHADDRARRTAAGPRAPSAAGEIARP